MKCVEDIQLYNSNIQEDRVYVFLDGLNDRLDKIRSDVLQMKPFPSVEQAYAHVRREDTRQAVMLNNTEPTSSSVLLSKGIRIQQPSIQISKLRMSSPSVRRKDKGQATDGGCTHCGNLKHTQDICFKLHGYPEWWKELKKRKTRASNSREETGRAAFTNTDHEPILEVDNNPSAGCQGNTGCGLFSSKQGSSNSWIIDSGASDYMTFDPQDL